MDVHMIDSHNGWVIDQGKPVFKIVPNWVVGELERALKSRNPINRIAIISNAIPARPKR